MRTLGLIFYLSVLFGSCSEPISSNQSKASGKLFIIGGGARPVTMLKELVNLSGIDSIGYAMVLPFASEEPDTALFYSIWQFTRLGLNNVYGVPADSLQLTRSSLLDSLAGAKLIYFSGGDQDKLMRAVNANNQAVRKAIEKAWQQGATIAGTSAGAAVMSQRMISGNQLKHPVYTGDFASIEANNIEIKEGMGFLQHCIVDQHFVKRQRMNRLITVALENPDMICLGIDEATALVVENGMGRVVGESQIIVLRHPNAETHVHNGLLGGNELVLDIYIPGDILKYYIN